MNRQMLVRTVICFIHVVLSVVVEGEQGPWRSHGDKEYLLITENMTWYAAQTVCQTFGGHLAHADTKSKNDFLMSITDASSWVWLGGTDIHREGDWKWVNPERPMTFTYWSTTGPQPNNGRVSNCMCFWLSRAGYMWADEPCSREYLSICERYQNTAKLPNVRTSRPIDGSSDDSKFTGTGRRDNEKCMKICL